MFGLAYLHLYSGGIITFVFIFTMKYGASNPAIYVELA